MKAAFLLTGSYQWYKGWKRTSIHVLFWLIISFYVAFRLSFSHKELNWLFVFVTLREVITILLIHYFFAGYVLPRVLLRAQWALFGAYLVLTYVFMVASQYYSFYFQDKLGLVPSYSAALVKFYLQYDFVHTLVEPVRMLNTILFYSTLFFTLLIKITKSFFISSMDRLNLEKEKVDLELYFLKAQINPHFLFNTLNNIYSLIVDKDDVASDIILRLSDLLRYSLYESNNTKIPLKRELQFFQDYVELEKIRHQNYVNITVDVQGDPEGFEIPPLVLITFLENAFKHGIKNTIAASWVTTRITIRDSTLHFCIQNSKPAKAKVRSPKEQGGIGLMNVVRRLDLIFPNRYHLAIDNQPDTYSVTLTIQFHEQIIEMRNSGRRASSPKPHREVY